MEDRIPALVQIFGLSSLLLAVSFVAFARAMYANARTRRIGAFAAVLFVLEAVDRSISGIAFVGNYPQSVTIWLITILAALRLVMLGVLIGLMLALKSASR